MDQALALNMSSLRTSNLFCLKVVIKTGKNPTKVITLTQDSQDVTMLRLNWMKSRLI